MGRPKKIWRRKEDGHWYTTEGTRKIKIADKGTSYRDAFALFKQRPDDPAQGAMTAKRLIDLFLDSVAPKASAKETKSEGTYTWYKSFLNPFARSLSDRLKVADCRVHHLQDWLEDQDTWNNNTKNAAGRSVLRCFNWGVKQQHIRFNPFTSVELPPRTPREVAINDKQFAEMLTHVEPAFADYLTFLYETGARPQEIKLLTAKHWDGEKFTLERVNSKGKKERRVIYTTPKVATMVKRLVRKYPKGVLFRNAEGNPWNPNTIRSRFRRRGRNGKFYGLSEKLKVPGLCATSLRHSFCTNALKRGVDTTTVAILMGHKDTSMVAKVYQHLAKDDDYMKSALARATSGGGILPVTWPDVSGTFQVPIVGS